MPSSAPAPRDPHSFPTRRSSDLQRRCSRGRLRGAGLPRRAGARPPHVLDRVRQRGAHRQPARRARRLEFPRHVRSRGGGRRRDPRRSEEHTSELQSRRDLVCRLLPPPPAIHTLSLHDALPIFNEDVVVAACEALGFHVEQVRGRRTFSIEFGNEALIDSLPGVPGGSNFLGTFDREEAVADETLEDRKSTRLNSSHVEISYAVFCPRPPRSTLFPYTTLFRSSTKM